MSDLIVPKKVPIALHPSPLTLEVRTHVALQGETIEQILKDIPGLPPEIWTHGLVFLGDYEVPRSAWHLVKPKGNSRYMMRVCIRYAGGGGGSEGGGGKSIIGTIAAIALVIAVTAISGGILGPAGALSISSTLFAAGSTSAALAAAGVAIVGSLAVNALSPTPSLQSDTTAQESDNISSLGSASARGNVIGAGQPIPFVAGRHRVSPPHIIIPWAESINDDQYVNAIVGLNGPHLFEDIWINGTPIEEFVDVEYEVRDVVNDDTSVTLIDKQVFENQVNAEIAGHKVNDDATDELQDDTTPENSYPQWQSARSKRMPDQIWTTFVWASLIFQEDDGSGTGVGGMAVRMRIRRVGDTDWINLPELHAQRERGQPFRATVKLIFQAAPQDITRPDQAPAFPPWKSALYVTDTENDEDFAVDDYFDDASTLFAANVGQTEGTIEIWLDPDVFPKGTYDVQVKRGYAYEANLFVASTYLLDAVIPYFFSHVPASSPPIVRQEQSKVPTNLSWASLASVWEEPPLGEAGMSLIALRAKNVSISSLSVLATGYANRWDGADWNTFEPTQNPAAWWRYLALGGQSIEVPIVEQQLDDQDFQEWHEICGDRTKALVFDGDGDYLTRDAGLTGAADSGLVTMSIWTRYEDEFDTIHDWTFDNDADNGFSSSGANQVVGDDYITLTSTGADPIFRSPSGLTIDGAAYRYVVIDMERVTDAGAWDGTLFYTTGGHGESGSFRMDFDPEAVVGERTVYVLDMAELTTGGTDWVTNIITQLRFDFSGANGDIVRVYSIKVMSPQQLIYFSSALGNQGDRFLAYIDPAGHLVIKGYSSAGTKILHVTSSIPLIADGHSHILFSCDLSDTNDRDLYINDTEALTVVTYTNASMDFTSADVSVGADPAGLQPLKGSLAEVWFEDGVYVDFSVEANRREFIDQYGRPVDLGPTGSLPTGTSPIVYLSGMTGDFEDNKGTGGGFTVNGSPTDALEKVTGGDPILECNAYFSAERSLTDVLQTVAATGHASKRISDKVGIIVDNDRSNEGPVESFTQRNSSGLTIRRAFPRIPDGLRIRFNDEDNDFQPNEIFVFRKFPANVIEAVDYVGITSEAAAQGRAALDFRQLILRNALYQLDTDIQHLYCTKGSLVVLPYDTVRRHFDSARIVKADTSGGDITDLHLDSALRLDLIGDARAAIFNPEVETRLLLHFEGADASTTFTDNSLTGHTFTAAGNAQIDTAESRFGSASGRFDGTGDWITAPDHADFTLGDQDFTIETWAYVDSATGSRHIAGQGDAAGDSNGRAWLIQRNTDGTIRANVWQGTTSFQIVSLDIYDDDENNPGWHHIAFVRKSDILWLFVDGVKQGSLAFTGSVNDSSDALGIGRLGGDSSTNPWIGWIEEFRMTVGRALYDDDFVPQTAAFDDPAETQLTRGAGLTGAADSGSGTFSFWLKFEDFPVADQHIFSIETSADAIRFAIILTTTGQIQLLGRSSAAATILDLEADTVLSPNQWYHVCGSIDLSNVANRSIFIDDLPSDLTVATYTNASIDFTSDDAAVGGRPGGTQLLQGSLAEFWFEDGLFTDFTVEANRRDFLSTNFRPTNLDADGSAPGVQPLIYLSGQDGDFPTNKGTGGGFTESSDLDFEYIFYTDSGFPAGVVIQLQDGTTLTAQVDEEGEVSVVTFTTPQALPSYFSDEGAWTTATGYLEYDVVTNGGETYAALTDHTSGAASEPGVGADWFDFWEPLLKDCLVASGPFSTLDKRMLVLGIKIKPDMSASLTLVDEGPKPYVTGQSGADDIYAPDGSRIRAPY